MPTAFRRRMSAIPMRTRQRAPSIYGHRGSSRSSWPTISRSCAVAFGIRPDGNAPEDPQGEFTGKTTCTCSSALEEMADRLGKTREEVESSLQRARHDAFPCTAGSTASSSRRQGFDRLERSDAGGVRTRIARVAGRGPTVALSRCGGAIGQISRAHMWDAGRQVLKRRYRDGDAAIDGYAEDYAYLIFGLIELFQAGGDPHWLEWGDFAIAGRTNSSGIRKRRLVQHNGRGPERHPSDEGRLRWRRAVAELGLGAQPVDAGASHGRSRTVRSDRQTLKMFGAHRPGRACRPDDDGCAVDLSCQVAQMVVVGRSDAESTKALMSEIRGEIRSVQRRSCPSTLNGPPGRSRAHASVHRSMEMRDGRPTAYVCHDFTAPNRRPIRLDLPSGYPIRC